MSTTVLVVVLVVLVAGYLVRDWFRDRRLARALSSGCDPDQRGRPEHHRDVHVSQSLPRADDPRFDGFGG